MLSDNHIHMILDGLEWRSAIARHSTRVDIPWIRKQLDIYRTAGYTYLRDGGDKWGAGAAARVLAPEYGITYRTPLAPLCMEGHYGSFIGQTWSDLNAYTALVKSHREKGADFIKIMISGLMDFDHFGVLTEPGLEERLIRELVYIAHEEGFSVMAHANGARTVEAAAAAGVDSVEHGAYLDKDALAAMKDSGTVWVPTLSTIGNLRGKGRFNEYAVEKILDSALFNVSEFSSVGGLIAVGTDAGAWQVPHGSLTEEDYLQMANADPTSGNAVIQTKF